MLYHASNRDDRCVINFRRQSTGGDHATAWQWSESGRDYDESYWGVPT